MQWSIVDACDTIKYGQEQMEEKYKKTETSMPLWKAYNTFENPKVSYNERIEQYPGPGSPTLHPSMQSNGFVNYQNSGGISRKDHLRDQINSIAEKIAFAK
jgi:acetone carboxylase gamma subunit|tara:strand:- start:634 stop:936 length:303 start_codon:yes stop_codon:yes gene_type:complete